MLLGWALINIWFDQCSALLLNPHAFVNISCMPRLLLQVGQTSSCSLEASEVGVKALAVEKSIEIKKVATPLFLSAYGDVHNSAWLHGNFIPSIEWPSSSRDIYTRPCPYLLPPVHFLLCRSICAASQVGCSQRQSSRIYRKTIQFLYHMPCHSTSV